MRQCKPSSVILNHISKDMEQAKQEWKTFQEICKNPYHAQSKVIMDILALEKKGIPKKNPSQKINSIKDFQDQIPLVEYKDIQSEIEDLYHGKRQENPFNPVKYFAMSSGTTGKNKIIPVTQKYISHYLKNNARFYYYNLLKDPAFAHYKIHNAVGNPSPRLTPTGIGTGLLSGFLFQEVSRVLNDISLSVPKHLNSQLKGTVRDLALLIFAVSSEISCINAVTTYPIYNIFNTIWEEWDKLKYYIFMDNTEWLSEIKANNVNPEWLPIIQQIGVFNPGPRRLKIIQELSNKNSKSDFFHQLWENLNSGFCLTQQSAGYYYNGIKDFYPDIQLISSNYVATEGIFNICMYQNFPSGSGPLCIDSLFFEFIEVNEKTNVNREKTLLAHELKKGKKYEIILTNWNYLYRYQLNDIIEVVDFFEQTPVIQFIEKKGKVLNIFQERTSFDQFQTALFYGLIHHKKLIRHWIVTPSYAGAPHYTFYLDEMMKSFVTAETCQKIDNKIQEQNIMYQTYRKSGAIGLLQIKFMPAKKFNHFFLYKMNTQNAGEQFKPIHLLSNKEDIDILTGK